MAGDHEGKDIASSPLMATEKWYEKLDRLLSEVPLRTGGAAPNPKQIVRTLETLKQRSEDAFDEMNKKPRAIDDDALTRRVLQNGTLTDKVAAMALAVGEFPLQSVSELERLVDMSGSKGRREATLAMDALRDLLMDALLPPNRRLNLLKVSLETLAVDRPGINNELLGLMKFEDVLKAQVAIFMRNLEKASKDELIHHKVTAMKRATDLLMERPEQERFLLSLLCSKMGDPDHKAAAQASHLLRKVINRHPQMRLSIVAELEASILSSSATPAYVYEAIIFLNQTVLFRGDVELANRLIDIYFALFEQNLRIVQMAEKAKPEKKRKKNKRNNKKKSPEVVEARKGLNSRLLAALLTGVNRALPFCEAESESAKLKFKERCDYLHRIVRETETFTNAIQALSLLFKLDMDRDRYHNALHTKLNDPALVDGKKTMFLNLLYRSLKSDTNRSRIAQMVKTLLHVALQSSSAFAAASLFLLSNLLATKPMLMVDLLGEEDVTDNTIPDDEVAKSSEAQEHETQSSTATLANVEGNEPAAATNGKKPKHEARKVAFSLAWELEAFRIHYHPTVQAFAKAILARDFIEYSGDPLHDFSVTAFLDRFVYRNPKEKKPIESEPDASYVFGAKGREQRIGKRTASELPVNSEAFHQKMAGRRTRIGEETDRFFFRYFDSLKKQGVSLAQGAASGRDADLEDLEDEYADELVEGLLKKAAGGEEADIDEDIELSGAEEEEDSDVEEDVGNPDFSGDDDAGDELDFDSMDEGEDFGEVDEDDEEDLARSAFADADDFAGLLEGSDETDDKGKEWLGKKHDKRERESKGKKRTAPSTVQKFGKKSRKGDR